VDNKLKNGTVVTPGFLGFTDTLHWIESPCSITCQWQRWHPSTSPWSSYSSRFYKFWRNKSLCERASQAFGPFLQLPPMRRTALIHFKKAVVHFDKILGGGGCVF